MVVCCWFVVLLLVVVGCFGSVGDLCLWLFGWFVWFLGGDLRLLVGGWIDLLVCVYCSVIDFDALCAVRLVIPAGDCFGLTFGVVVVVDGWQGVYFVAVFDVLGMVLWRVRLVVDFLLVYRLWVVMLTVLLFAYYKFAYSLLLFSFLGCLYGVL